MDIKWRKAVIDDLDSVMVAVEDARRFLAPQGGGQWQFGYPNRDDFRADIEAGRLYAALDEEGNIAGVAAFAYEEEGYNHLYAGNWLSELPYRTLHRIAVREDCRGKGYGKALFELFESVAREEGYLSLRADTHENNAIMRHLLASAGYVCCGKVILYPNKDRLVFEKVLR